MKKNKRLIYILLGTVVLVGVFSIFNSGQGVSVDTVQANKDDLRVMVRGEGQTRVLESFLLTTPVSGQLGRFEFNVGDMVSEGDLLFTVVPLVDSEQSREVAISRLEAAQARLGQANRLLADALAVAEQAEVTLTRQQKLAELEIISQQALDQVELAAQSARRQFEASKDAADAAAAEVRGAEALLVSGEADRERSGLSVVAPISGSILRITDRSSRAVMAGEILLEIGDISQMELVVDVLSEDAVRISSGSDVEITGWGGERSLQGIVKRVEPSAFTKFSALGVEEQRVNVIIDYNDSPAGLGVGFRAEAGIVVWEGEDVVLAPVNAIFQIDGAWFIFVVVEDIVEQRSIEIGERSSELVQIVSGVEEGEEIVRYPSAAVEDGVTVQRQ